MAKKSDKAKEPKEKVKRGGAKKEVKKGKKPDKKKKIEKKPPSKKRAAPKKKGAGKEKVATKGIKEEKKAPVKEEEKVKKEKIIEKIKFHGKREVPELLKLRKKKPRFMRQELPKLKRLKDKWRRPRGIDSKKQDGRRGKGELPKIGYKKPVPVREIHPSGFYPVLVHNSKELALINPEEDAAIIAKVVGRKKRNEIIKSANTLKVTILNPRKGEI
jgi:large subunit ribosomal protein L32e